MATKNLIATSLSTWVGANFSSGTVPAAGDTVLVCPACTLNLNGSTLDRTADDSSAGGADVNGLDLAEFKTLPGSQIAIGSTATPLKCLVTSRLKHEGSGSLHFSSDRDGGVLTSSGYFQINSPNAVDAFNLTGSVDVATIEVISGGCTHSTTPVTQLVLSPKGSSIPVKWICAEGTAPPTTILMRGGELETTSGGNGGSTVYLHGGTLTIKFLSGYAGPDVTMFGGYLRWNSLVPAVGNASNLTALGGVVDFRWLPGYPPGDGTFRPALNVFKYNRRVTILGDYNATTERYIGE